MLSNVIGRYAAASIAILTAFIIFGVANAYMTGMSRVIYAASRDGALPEMLNKLDPKTSAPSRALVALFLSAMVALVFFYFLNVNLEDALLIPSGSAIIVYVIGSSAGIKLMRDNRTKLVFAGISLVISLIILPFVGILLAASFGTILAALVYATYSLRKRKVNLKASK